MNPQAEKINDLLKQYPQYKELLFARGYLITDDNSIDFESYPFFGNWTINGFGKYKICTNVKQKCYVYSDSQCDFAIIGHAYNPFNMVYNESEILEELCDEYKKSKDAFFEKVSELTGIHLIVVNDNGKLIAVQDCTGYKSVYYGKNSENAYIASCPQLIADILDLQMDEFVYELINSKCYNIGNRHLPGDYTPFKSLKRLGPNTYLKYEKEFTVERFYPVKPHAEIETEEEFENGIKNIYQILHNNIELASKKWSRPAISLSGATDSKTTLSCANGLYDKFFYYSFHCKPAEVIDSEAAHRICENIGVEHVIYPITENNEDIKDFEVFKQILAHNTSYFKRTADNEIRKYIFLLNLDEFDVELKSWSSEIARVFFERKYRIKMPKMLNERHYSIFQTRYFGNKKLLKKSDEIYRNFIKKIGLNQKQFNFENTDLAYWEVRMGAWGTSVSSSFDFCHEVTMPFNNRKLIELFLSFPHDDREVDKVHKEVIKYANKEIHDLNVAVKNNYFKSYRIWLEKIYFYYRTLFFKSKM